MKTKTKTPTDGIGVTLHLPVHGIVVKLLKDDNGIFSKNGSIESDMRDDPLPDESSKELRNRQECNCTIDGIESMILHHAISGVDIQSIEYIYAIGRSLEDMNSKKWLKLTELIL